MHADGQLCRLAANRPWKSADGGAQSVPPQHLDAPEARCNEPLTAPGSRRGFAENKRFVRAVSGEDLAADRMEPLPPGPATGRVGSASERRSNGMGRFETL